MTLESADRLESPNPVIKPPKLPRSRWWQAGLALLLAGAALGVAKLLLSQGAGPERPVSLILPVKTRQAQPVASYRVTRAYTGEIKARRSSELGFERSGELVAIAVDEGDPVRAGMALATLDTRNLAAERRALLAQRAQAVAKLQELQAGPRAQSIAAARAEVRDRQQQLELALTKRTRRQALLAEGAISREQLDEVAFEAGALEGRLAAAQSNLDELLAGTRTEQVAAQVAAVQQLEASLSEIEVDLAKSTLRAPFTGRIAVRQVDEGTVVDAGQTVLRLVEAGALEVRIGVPAQVAARLQSGSQHRVRVGGQTYTAQVSSRLPELDASTRTITVVLSLSQAAVAPGQTARLELTETIPIAGFRLPSAALVPGVRGLWSAYALAEVDPGIFRVERREVEILHTESDQVLVRGTLQAGERLIVDGAHRVVPGQLVTPSSQE